MLKSGHSIASDHKIVNRLFYTLLFLHLIPLFFGKYFLTQDGPSHLYNAFIFKDLLSNPHSIFANYFDINKVPNPNWLVTVFYSFLMLFFPPFAAEKIFLVLYVLFLPLSFRFLIRQINPNSPFITLLIFPLVYNITLYLGFFNFCFSIIIYFYATGYWLKYQGLFNIKRFLVFLILVTFIYFSHPVSFVILCMTIGVFIVSELISDIRGAKKALLSASKRISVFALCLIPSLIFFAMFFRGIGAGMVFTRRYVKVYIVDQLQNYGLYFMGKTDLRICTVFAAILVFFFIYNLVTRIKNKRFYRLDILYLFFALFSILTFFSPEEIAGGSVILIRLILYSNIIAIICISAYSYPKNLKKYSTYLFFAFAMFWLGFRSYYFLNVQSELHEFMSIENNIPEGKTLLPFIIQKSNPDGSPVDTKRDIDINIFQHAANYISLEKKLICLANYEAEQSYFPIKWKAEKSPSGYFQENGEMLKDSSISSYKAKVKAWPDYILIWDESGHVAERKALIKEMVKNYVLDQIQSNNKVALYRKTSKI